MLCFIFFTPWSNGFASTQTFYLYDCRLISCICSVNSSQQGSLICIHFAFIRLVRNEWKCAASIARVSLSSLSLPLPPYFSISLSLDSALCLTIIICFYYFFRDLPSFFLRRQTKTFILVYYYYWLTFTDTFAWRMVTVTVLTFKWDQFKLKAFRLAVTQINRFMRLRRSAPHQRRQSSFFLVRRRLHQFRENIQYLKISTIYTFCFDL